jgi:hypothetical protein
MAHAHNDPLDQWLSSALTGLITGGGMWHRGVFVGLGRVGGYLAGTWDPPTGEDGPGVVGDGSWTSFIGRIGAIALRAAAPSTGAEHREALLRLLEVWADTPFADPTARLRTGDARAEGEAVRDGRGATVATTWPRDGRCAVVQLRTGDADPPGFGDPTNRAEVARGWGDPGQLRRFVALVREQGPMAWDPAAARLLGEETGLSRAGAALIMMGDAGQPLLPDRRRVLGLGPAEAVAGADEVRRMSEWARLDLFANVLPDDPAQLWEPTGPSALAARIAAAWQARFGRSVAPPEDTLAAVATLATFSAAARICAAFLAPDTDAMLTTDLDSWLANGFGGAYCTSENQGVRWFEDLLRDIVGALPLVYADLPGKDPVRAGLPGVVAALRARLEHPGLLLQAGYVPHREECADRLRDLFGDRPYAGPEPLVGASFDDGLTVATIIEPDEENPRPNARVYFRPANYGDDARSAHLRRVAAEYAHSREAVDVLRGDWCARVVERIAGDALPEGAYESNPAVSAPDTVAQVVKALGVPDDAATLYLQLLALELPTDRRVRTWNGWNTARHRQASAALVTAGVVHPDKRARAGRGIFLPGDWAKARKPLWPMETWKANVSGVRLIGREVRSTPRWTSTLPELFAHVWTLVERGDGPA